MVNPGHREKILRAIGKMATANGCEGDFQACLEFFFSQNTLLYDEAALDTFLAAEDVKELNVLRAQKVELEAEIERLENR